MRGSALLLFFLAWRSSGVHGRILPDEMRLAKRPVMEAPCACADPSHCAPIQEQRATEVFGFGGDGNWSSFGWDVMTTIAWATDPELICHAHANGVRVVAAAPSFTADLLTTNNNTVRELWIDSTVAMVRAQRLDGITFDFESPIAWNDPAREHYVQLVNETTQALHKEVPGSQVSVCVAWSPDDIDGRAYDNAGLAAASDLLYVMMYDTQSQIFDRCIASANSPASRAARGIQRYVDLGISRDKLILGTPWYGYDYPCLSLDSSSFCPIEFVPFRGVNCSDAAGKEFGFLDIQKKRESAEAQVDESTQSLWFDYKNPSDGKMHQIWFDDAATSSIKYDIAKKLGVRGVGPYRYDQLDHSFPLPIETKAMWDALRRFSFHQ